MSHTDASSDIPEIFKALLEQSFPFPVSDDENEKEKLSGDEVDFMGGVSELGSSASLTPAIWNKTIPYDGKSFHLEYMDLEDFLTENGISVSEDVQQKSLETENSKEVVEKDPTIKKTEPGSAASVCLLPITELEHCDEEVTTVIPDSDSVQTQKGLTTEQERLTPEPINPENIEIVVNFEPDPADLLLSTVPGGELFNPRKHRFTEEDLKPQPIIKKAKKIFVPEEQKNEKYWQRRKKNNVAAKRSREARRLKENQIAVRAAFLEQENMALRQEVAELRKNLGCCKKTVACYESKYGSL